MQEFDRFGFLHVFGSGVLEEMRTTLTARVSACLVAVACATSAAIAPANDRHEVQFTVQSCHDATFEFLFNDEARRAFDSCEEPLVGFTVLVVGNLGVLDRTLSDDNGSVELGPVEVEAEERLSIAICDEVKSCIHYDGLSIADGSLEEGQNFVLYRDGRAGE